MIISAETGMSSGSSETPTTEQALRPISGPHRSTSKPEQPSLTAGLWLKHRRAIDQLRDDVRAAVLAPHRLKPEERDPDRHATQSHQKAAGNGQVRRNRGTRSEGGARAA